VFIIARKKVDSFFPPQADGVFLVSSGNQEKNPENPVNPV
jgi:hypothetical protein